MHRALTIILRGLRHFGLENGRKDYGRLLDLKKSDFKWSDKGVYFLTSRD